MIDSRHGVLGRSRRRSGTSAWEEEQVLFEAPTPEDVNLVLVGLDGSAGHVWFDGLRLEPVPRPRERDVRIFNQRITKGPIDLKQCGQFIEPLCRLLPSMLAQQVESTSFEEEAEWWPSYTRKSTNPTGPGIPTEPCTWPSYSFDTENPIQRQALAEDRASRSAGSSRDCARRFLSSRRAWATGFDCTCEAEGMFPCGHRSPATARVQPALFCWVAPATNWQGAETVLRSTRDVQNATLNIEFEGPGSLWLDRIYMIDEDAVLGLWRRDVVAALKEMTPGVIRFGGSSLEVFEWDQCIGPWDTRVPYTTIPWRGLEPNFVGVEEFVQLCQYVGAEPLVCVRWTGKTPADAAAEVEYFNGGPQTRWGKVRAQNGHRGSVRGEVLADRK